MLNNKERDEMKNLNELEIKNVEFNTDWGFFCVEFENGKSLQCCLKAITDKDGCYQGFYEQVEIDNNGYNDGICWDVNEWAADEDGEHKHIQDFLIEQAREIGLEIV